MRQCQGLTDGRPRSICPCCEQEGQASEVVAGRGIRTIHYVCAACSCEWVDEIPFPDSQWMFVTPSESWLALSRLASLDSLFSTGERGPNFAIACVKHGPRQENLGF